MKSETSGIQDENDVRFDPADVQDALALESQRTGKMTITSFLGVARKAVVRKRFMFTVALLGLMILLFFLRQHGYFAPDKIILFLRSHSVAAPVIFAVIYAITIICLVPALPMNLGAGLIWGPYWGGLLTVIGAGAGSALAFLVARYLASDFLNRKFRHAAWIRLRAEIQRKEWETVAFTRINPIFPFGALSYFFGLTSIRFNRYLITTLISITPASILFAGVGSSIGGIALDGNTYQFIKDVLAISLAVTLLVMLKIVIKRVARQATKRGIPGQRKKTRELI